MSSFSEENVVKADNELDFFCASQSQFDRVCRHLKDDQKNKLRFVDWESQNSYPRMFDTRLYYNKLETSELGRYFLYGDCVSSTQNLMNDWFAPIKEPLVMAASNQTSGRGRGQNVWTSALGCLLFTLKLQTSHAEYIPFVQYLVSLALVDAIHAFHSPEVLPVRIKWPNDLYLNGLKLGGILCQSTYLYPHFDITIGVGLNVSNAQPTICLNSYLADRHPHARSVTREELLAKFLTLLEQYWQHFELVGFRPFLDRYLQTWLHTNQEVNLQNPDGSGDSLRVTVQGLTEEGFLKASDAQGRTFELHPDGNSFDFFSGLICRKIK
eukprot:TRINITY_DN2976_c0_g1_i4.p1 TRINITY_DN2976_c0_g1~~TRINITY_DN2976_c0_g1_i4.p1  ORF type:complete len:325 (-),score=33.12 TRINITY_DN2976_c0_g1_i4:22-996(-)